jgi:hypothetical protein
MPRVVLVRLASFLLIIVGTFGTAYGVGSNLPGNPESKPHTHGPVAPSPVPAGFEVDGYVLVNAQSQPSTSSPVFYIKDRDGRRVTDFTEAQGAPVHVVLIRFDVSGFEHLDPEIEADGSFVVPLSESGKWHIIVDAQPADSAAPIVLSTTIDDEVLIDAAALPLRNDTVTLDSVVVTRDGLDFTVTSRDGSPAEGLQPYLGQPAHLFAVRQGDLAYTHFHPVESTNSTFSFMGDLPPGTSRLFLEFGLQGDVMTTVFTVVQP